jgi:hypothetical protein
MLGREIISTWRKLKGDSKDVAVVVTVLTELYPLTVHYEHRSIIGMEILTESTKELRLCYFQTDRYLNHGLPTYKAGSAIFGVVEVLKGTALSLSARMCPQLGAISEKLILYSSGIIFSALVWMYFMKKF